MEKLTEFPALEDRKSYLEHALYQATQQSNDAAFEGKPVIASEQWLSRIVAELRELRYALWVLGSQGSSKIDVPGRTLIVAVIVLALVMFAQLAILVTVGH